jgi:hypothetical protein
MNCRDLDALFESGGNSPWSEAAERHLSTCPACRHLATVLESAASRPTGTPPHPVLPVNLLESLQPVRPLSRTPALIFAVILSAALVWAAAIARWGLAGWGAQTTIERLLLFGTVAVALLASAYGLSVEMVPGSKPRFNWRWVAACALVAFLLTTLSAFHQEGRFDLGAMHGTCFGRGLLAAAAVLLLLFVVIRRGVFLERLKTSATIAALISSAALLVLTSYCPILAWPHVLVVHLGAVAVIIAAGIAVGKLVE